MYSANLPIIIMSIKEYTTQGISCFSKRVLIATKAEHVSQSY